MRIRRAVHRRHRPVVNPTLPWISLDLQTNFSVIAILIRIWQLPTVILETVEPNYSHHFMGPAERGALLGVFWTTTSAQVMLKAVGVCLVRGSLSFSLQPGLMPMFCTAAITGYRTHPVTNPTPRPLKPISHPSDTVVWFLGVVPFDLFFVGRCRCFFCSYVFD
jgi:hypothetical protein